jgi:hypothetical protein
MNSSYVGSQIEQVAVMESQGKNRKRGTVTIIILVAFFVILAAIYIGIPLGMLTD